LFLTWQLRCLDVPFESSSVVLKGFHLVISVKAEMPKNAVDLILPEHSFIGDELAITPNQLGRTVQRLITF